MSGCCSQTCLFYRPTGIGTCPPAPQIPRLYNIYKETGVIDSFEDMLANLFEPLFEVTANPESHPQLHVFLSQVRTCGNFQI